MDIRLHVVFFIHIVPESCCEIVLDVIRTLDTRSMADILIITKIVESLKYCTISGLSGNYRH